MKSLLLKIKRKNKMSEIAVFNVNESAIRILFHENPDCEFKGQKLMHGFETTGAQTGGLRYSECSSLNGSIDKSTRFYVKFDGSCGEYVNGAARRRYDRKVKKNANKWNNLPHEKALNYVACSEDPGKPWENKPFLNHFHWPFMRDIAKDSSLKKVMGDKHYVNAAENFEKTAFFKNLRGKTIRGEWMGPKVNNKPTDPLTHNTFIPFNMIEFVIPENLLNYRGFYSLFNEVANIEGLVAYCKDGSIFKIRRDMFVYETGTDVNATPKRMGWGKRPADKVKMPQEIRKALGKSPNFAEYIRVRL